MRKRVDMPLQQYEEHQRIIQSLQDSCHGQSAEMGWWKDADAILQALPGELAPKAWAWIVAGKLALGHSELSEALEGFRKGLKDDHLPHRPMVEVELADAIIRIFDLAGRLDLDLAGALIEKLVYNRQRADHKMENRDKPGGKKI